MMRDRRRTQVMARLVAVQRAKRAGAEAELGQARQRERQARDVERDALAGSEAAEQDWRMFISAPGFAPEYGQALASRLVAADDRAQEATTRARAASEAHASRTRQWQALEAQVRSSEIRLNRLERRLARRDEERRVAEQADRVTFGASR